MSDGDKCGFARAIISRAIGPGGGRHDRDGLRGQRLQGEPVRGRRRHGSHPPSNRAVRSVP
jgi:hypothetical protein